tara:strand:- start:62 stop:211 length:150 start_codon:yes stop_codon:yes gene_type:complete
MEGKATFLLEREDSWQAIVRAEVAVPRYTEYFFLLDSRIKFRECCFTDI